MNETGSAVAPTPPYRTRAPLGAFINKYISKSESGDHPRAARRMAMLDADQLSGLRPTMSSGRSPRSRERSADETLLHVGQSPPQRHAGPVRRCFAPPHLRHGELIAELRSAGGGGDLTALIRDCPG